MVLTLLLNRTYYKDARLSSSHLIAPYIQFHIISNSMSMHTSTALLETPTPARLKSRRHMYTVQVQPRYELSHSGATLSALPAWRHGISAIPYTSYVHVITTETVVEANCSSYWNRSLIVLCNPNQFPSSQDVYYVSWLGIPLSSHQDVSFVS